MTDRDALEAVRALFGAGALWAGFLVWRALRRDLATAEVADHATLEAAHERVRRMTRMRSAARRAGSYAVMAAGVLIVAVMALADHPLLPLASNINQIIQGVLLLRLAELEGHLRESLAGLAEAVPSAEARP